MAVRRPTEIHGVLEDAPLTDLVRDAFDEAKELVRLEVELAKDEALIELRQLRAAAVSLAIAASASMLVGSLLAMALVFALGGTAVAALGVAGGFLLVAVVAGLVGYAKLPTKPLEKTRDRLQSDMKQLKEHLA